MSNTAVLNVMLQSQSTGVQRLVLLALAVHCNDARGDMVAWPTITRIAELANIQRPNASRAIKQLISSGELVLTGHKVGRNLAYKIVLPEQSTVSPRYADEINPPYHHDTATVSPRYASRITMIPKLERTRKELELDTNVSKAHAPEILKSPAIKKPKKEVLQLPENVCSVDWQGFVDMRKKIKAPLTDRAMELSIKQLVDFGDDANEILRRSTQNAWRGLFPLKGQKNNATNHNNKQPATFAEKDAATARDNSQQVDAFWESFDSQGGCQ